MAEYGKIFKRLWKSERFKALDDDGKLLCVYVMTSPHSNSVGIYVLEKFYILGDLKTWNENRLDLGLSQIIENGWVCYDFDKQVILINDWYKDGFHTIQNQNQLKKHLADLSETPRTHLIQTYIDQLKNCSNSMNDKSLQQMLDGLYNRLPNGFEAVDLNKKEPLSEPFRNKEAVAEAETEEETEAVAEADCNKKIQFNSQPKPKNINVLKVIEKITRDSGDWMILYQGFNPKPWVESLVLRFGLEVVLTSAETIYKYYLNHSVPVPTSTANAREKFWGWCEREIKNLHMRTDRKDKGLKKFMEDEFEGELEE